MEDPQDYRRRVATVIFVPFVPEAAYHPNLAGMTAVADLVDEAVRNGRIVGVGDES